MDGFPQLLNFLKVISPAMRSGRPILPANLSIHILSADETRPPNHVTTQMARTEWPDVPVSRVRGTYAQLRRMCSKGCVIPLMGKVPQPLKAHSLALT